MKKRNKTILIAILAIVVISNLPPVYYFIGEQYHYRNKDGSFSFTEQPSTIQDFKMTTLKFKSFKAKNPKNPYRVLYRNFRFKPWKFWEWRNILKYYRRYSLDFYSL